MTALTVTKMVARVKIVHQVSALVRSLACVQCA